MVEFGHPFRLFGGWADGELLCEPEGRAGQPLPAIPGEKGAPGSSPGAFQLLTWSAPTPVRHEESVE